LNERPVLLSPVPQAS